MIPYVITTDTTADLPEEYLVKHNISVMSLTYTLNGTTYDREHPLDVKEFYDTMRNGALPTTSQVNPEIAKSIFKEVAEKNQCDILHIAFSSGLSGSYGSACIAASELEEENFPFRVVVIDSLSASLGEGLLVHKATVMREQGASLDETAKWLEDNKLHLVHNFTVDDLNHLCRGGRVSKTSAFIGSIVNIKPLLHVDDEGHLTPVAKIRGRKKALTSLVDCMEKQMGSYRNQNDIVFISHGDSPEDARHVADMIQERFGIDSFLIDYIGPTIGAHAGPGTIALFYMGEYR